MQNEPRCTGLRFDDDDRVAPVSAASTPNCRRASPALVDAPNPQVGSARKGGDRERILADPRDPGRDRDGLTDAASSHLRRSTGIAVSWRERPDLDEGQDTPQAYVPGGRHLRPRRTAAAPRRDVPIRRSPARATPGRERLPRFPPRPATQSLPGLRGGRRHDGGVRLVAPEPRLAAACGLSGQAPTTPRASAKLRAAIGDG